MARNPETPRAPRTATAPVEPAVASPLTKVSWGAVFAGVVLSLTVMLVLNMFGIGIGAATIDPVANNTPSPTSFSVGAGLWWTISGIIAAFAGGFIASRLSGRPSRSTGGWHGLTVWALSTLVVFYLLSSALSNMIGTTYSTLGDLAGGLASTTTAAVQNIEPAAGQSQTWQEVQDTVGNELDQMMGDLQTEDVRQAVSNVIQAAFSNDENAVNMARNEAITIIAEAQGISRNQARQRLDQYIQRVSGALGTATETVEESADVVANRISQAAWFTAIALVLGAIAAWFGGKAGTVLRPL